MTFAKNQFTLCQVYIVASHYVKLKIHIGSELIKQSNKYWNFWQSVNKQLQQCYDDDNNEPCCCSCPVPLGRPSLVQNLRQKKYVTPESEVHFLEWQKSNFCISTNDGSTIHFHLHNFDTSLKRRKIFSRNSTIVNC